LARLYYFNEDQVECVVELPLDGTPVAVGRLASCKIVTRNFTVSRKHAEFQFENGRFVFRDLGSSNGSYFGGQRIPEHTLADGDKVFCGNFEIRFEHTEIPEAAPQWEDEFEEAEVVEDADALSIDLGGEDEPPPLYGEDGIGVLGEPDESAVLIPIMEEPQEPRPAPPLPPHIAKLPKRPETVGLIEAVSPDMLEELEEPATPPPPPPVEPPPPPVEPAPAPVAPVSLAQLPAALAEREEEIKRLNVEVESLQSAVNVLQASEAVTNAAKVEENAKLKDQLRQLKDQLEDAKEAAENLETAHAHVAALEGHVKEQRAKGDELRAEIEKLNGMVEDKNHEYQELFSKYSKRMGVDEVLEGLREEHEELKSSVEDVEALREQAARDRDEAREALGALRQEQERAAEVAEASRQEALEELRGEHQAELDRLAGERAELERSVADARSAHEETHAGMKSVLWDLGALMDLTEPDELEVKEAIRELRRGVEDRDDQITEVEADADALRGRIRELEDNVSAREKDVEDLRREFQTYRSEKHDEVGELRRQMQEFPPDRFNDLSEQLVRLTDENRQLKTITEDISFILGLGYSVAPEEVKSAIKELKTTTQRLETVEAQLKEELADQVKATKKVDGVRKRLEGEINEATGARERMREELDANTRELRKMKLFSEQYSQDRFTELEQKLKKVEVEGEELQRANRTYLRKVSGLIEEKNGLERKLEEAERKMFDDRKEKELGDLLERLQEEKEGVEARLGKYEGNTGRFVEAFSDKYSDWKMNLQIVTGVTEDLQDEVENNPIAKETLSTLVRYLGELREGSNELKKLLYQYREAVGDPLED
jgi:chromosome segregation ATPase